MRAAPPIATASSMSAAGRSRPNEAASRPRAALPANVPITGTLEGVEQVGKMWRALMGPLDRFEVVPSRFEHSGDRVLATVTFRGSGERGDFEFSGAQVFTIRDGLIAEVHEFRSLPEARELLS